MSRAAENNYPWPRDFLRLFFLLGCEGKSLKFIDPREGERVIPLDHFNESNKFCRVLTLSRRAGSATKRFDITYFFPYLRRFRRSLILVFVASIFINIFSDQ